MIANSIFSKFVFVFFLLWRICEACIPTQQIETTTTTTTTVAPIYGCPDATWTIINRATYYWCAQAISYPEYPDEYVTECANLHANAKVWGVQDQAELQTMLTLTRTLVTVGRLGFGAKRVSTCEAVIGVDASCTALNSFEWTDGSTTGTDGFYWMPGFPANPYGSSDPANYLQTDISTGEMYDYYGNSYWEAAICGMLPIQLN
ncbi:unnamed protein product [Caenorhabditis angaria]|uniref:C-type lectin domain-containing protein n=1 Tax=Caenorhabditis angaria TaxID=860376 RepID=A0A9P1N3Y6_9PELO|nr:unnamed protein product [Caenorhabditis angaria]